MTRIFLSFAFVFIANSFAVLCDAADTDQGKWYRGNTHMHSFWSDGNVYPEQAVDWYKEHGYQFVVLSDHTYLQLDPQRWINVGTGHWIPLYEKFVEKYGKQETKEENGKQRIRLHTFSELKEKLDIPGQFLMIPGHEINDGANGVTLHMIAMNVSDTIPFCRGETLAESIRLNAFAVRNNGDTNGHPTAMIVNHHAWPYYDIDPLSVAAVPEARFFEFLCANGGPSASYDTNDKFWSREKYFDAVTAFRIAKGYPICYGIGADDTHDYTEFGDRRDNPGESWIVVRAKSLDATEILKGMYRGDFYISTGVSFDDITFDGKTLNVKIAPEDGVHYEIRFVGTKKDFNRETVPFTVEKGEKNPRRSGYTLSDDIGVTLAEIKGTVGSYTLQEDDLYVRAIITSDRKNPIQAGYEPDYDSAWTQPYTDK